MTIPFENAEARRVFFQAREELMGLQKIAFTEAIELLHNKTGKKIKVSDIRDVLKKEGITQGPKIITKGK